MCPRQPAVGALSQLLLNSPLFFSLAPCATYRLIICSISVVVSGQPRSPTDAPLLGCCILRVVFSSTSVPEAQTSYPVDMPLSDQCRFARHPTFPSVPGTGCASATPHPEAAGNGSSWSVPAWLRSLDLAAAVAPAIKPPDGLDPFRYMQAIEKEQLEESLRAAGLGGLAPALWEAVGALRQQEESSAQALSEKFANEASFNLQYGSLETFFGGLIDLIGGPKMIEGSLIKAMEYEHCDGPDADSRFTASNGLTTSSREEWEFVVDPRPDKIYGERNGFRTLVVDGVAAHPEANGAYDEVPGEAVRFRRVDGDVVICWAEQWYMGPDADIANAFAVKAGADTRAAVLSADEPWLDPKGEALSSAAVSLKELVPDKCRQRHPLDEFMEQVEAMNVRLAAEGQPPLLQEELVGGRLYTGCVPSSCA